MATQPRVFAQCRSLGHEWRHASGREVHTWGVVLRSVCSDCGTERVKDITSRGELGRTRYTYPEGYSQHGDERLPLQEWRSLFVVSFMDPEPPTKTKRKRR